MVILLSGFIVMLASLTLLAFLFRVFAPILGAVALLGLLYGAVRMLREIHWGELAIIVAIFTSWIGLALLVLRWNDRRKNHVVGSAFFK